MTTPDEVKDMRRAIYYASRGIRTAYLKYEGDHRDEVYEVMNRINRLYISLKEEEAFLRAR